MNWCLKALSRCLNQCWLLISQALCRGTMILNAILQWPHKLLFCIMSLKSVCLKFLPHLIGPWESEEPMSSVQLMARRLLFRWHHIDGLVQHCSNSSALAMELLQSCAKPSLYLCKQWLKLGPGDAPVSWVLIGSKLAKIITWTNVDLSSIGPLWANRSGIWTTMQRFASENAFLFVCKCRPLWRGLKRGFVTGLLGPWG